MKTTPSLSHFEALETMPLAELELRHARVRHLMERLTPEASGIMAFSRVNIYYLTGTLASGVVWLPREGKPVLLVRKGLDRAALESPLQALGKYQSFRQLPALLEEFGSPLGRIVAVDKGGLSWSMADMLTQRVADVRFVAGDAVLNHGRMVKTPWELAKLREAGKRHAEGLTRILPRLIHIGMTEQEIVRHCIDTYLDLGHGGIERMNAHGEEVFFGHVAADDSGNYPHYYNGPMGFRGLHPAQPCLGSQTVWRKGTPLTVDMAFSWQGYITDKTQAFWAGNPQSLPDNYREAYDICVAVHERASAALKPGAVPSEIWKDTLAYVGKTSYREGFMGLGDNKVPFLGHGIGLAIDEQPVFASGFDDPLQEGMTVALEPKIGLPGLGMVGIENTFEITGTGSACLSGDNTRMIFIEE